MMPGAKSEMRRTESLPSAPDLKMLLIALRTMEERPQFFTATIRHSIMLAEASLKSFTALEARVAALEAQHPAGPWSAESLASDHACQGRAKR